MVYPGNLTQLGTKRKGEILGNKIQQNLGMNIQNIFVLIQALIS